MPKVKSKSKSSSNLKSLKSYKLIKFLVVGLMLLGVLFIAYQQTFAYKIFRVLKPTILYRNDNSKDYVVYDYGVRLYTNENLKGYALKIESNCATSTDFNWEWALGATNRIQYTRYTVNIPKNIIDTYNTYVPWKLINANGKTVYSGSVYAPKCKTNVSTKLFSEPSYSKRDFTEFLEVPEVSYEWKMSVLRNDPKVYGNMKFEILTNCNGFGQNHNGNFTWSGQFDASNINNYVNHPVTYGNYIRSKYVTREQDTKYRITVNGAVVQDGTTKGPYCYENLSNRKIYVENPDYSDAGNGNTRVEWTIRSLDQANYNNSDGFIYFQYCQNTRIGLEKSFNNKRITFDSKGKSTISATFKNSEILPEGEDELVRYKYSPANPQFSSAEDVVKVPKCTETISFPRSTIAPLEGVITAVPVAFDIVGEDLGKLHHMLTMEFTSKGVKHKTVRYYAPGTLAFKLYYSDFLTSLKNGTIPDPKSNVYIDFYTNTQKSDIYNTSLWPTKVSGKFVWDYNFARADIAPQTGLVTQMPFPVSFVNGKLVELYQLQIDFVNLNNESKTTYVGFLTPNQTRAVIDSKVFNGYNVPKNGTKVYMTLFSKAPGDPFEFDKWEYSKAVYDWDIPQTFIKSTISPQYGAINSDPFKLNFTTGNGVKAMMLEIKYINQGGVAETQTLDVYPGNEYIWIGGNEIFEGDHVPKFGSDVIFNLYSRGDSDNDNYKYWPVFTATYRNNWQY